MSSRMDEINALNRELDDLERRIKWRRAATAANERYNRKYARKYKKGRIIHPDWSQIGE